MTDRSTDAGPPPPENPPARAPVSLGTQESHDTSPPRRRRPDEPEAASEVVPPWLAGPGYVAPLPQSIDTEAPQTIGSPLDGRAVAEVIEHSRALHTAEPGRRGRVRILWERLVTSRRRDAWRVATIVTLAIAVCAACLVEILQHL